jgi:uncharacterized phage protein (TIGR01671 family)
MEDRFKFRVWLKHSEKMIYIDKKEADDLFSFLENVNDRQIIMQCTGLKDKNGKLIFEGDIVRYAEYEIEEIKPEWKYTEIVWGGSFDYPAFDLKQHNFDSNGLSEIFACGWTIEVIGNIYQNKDLLNENG